MTRLMRFSLLIMMLGLSRTALAQTPPAPAPWPPDPNAIFAEGVEWRVMEAETTVTEPIELDYVRKMIRVLDAETDTWREYPFPDTRESANFARLLSNGLIWIDTYREYGGDPQPGQVVLLNPETGVYTQPPTICEDKVIQAEVGEGKWVVAYHGEEKTKVFLCHSETGEQRETLPESSSKWTTWSVYPTQSSTRLLLAAQDGNFDLFAYDLTTDEITALGTIESDSDYALSAPGWVSESRGLLAISHTYSSWPATSYYAFDIDEVNSLERAFHGWWDSIYGTRSPKRIISVMSQDYSASHTGGRSREHKPCVLSIYDTEGLHTHELGYECIPSIVNQYRSSPAYQQGNFLYYLVKHSEDAGRSELFRYDIAQDTIQQIEWIGEFEGILSVSPDNRYVVVLVDNNGILDFPWQQPQFCCAYTHGRRLMIIDTHTDQTRYQSEPMAVYRANQLVWVDASTLIIMAHDSHYGDIETWTWGKLQQIYFGDNYYESQLTTEYGSIQLDPSPDKRYGLSEDYRVINLRTLEAMPFLLPSLSDTYSVSTGWQEDGRLEVEVVLKDDHSQRITYLVMLAHKP